MLRAAIYLEHRYVAVYRDKRMNMNTDHADTRVKSHRVIPLGFLFILITASILTVLFQAGVLPWEDEKLPTKEYFVYDGDTVQHNGTSYQLDGVDAPELDQPGGVQARDAIRRMKDMGYELRAIKGADGGFGRKVGILTREGDVSASQALVNAGLGNPLPERMNRTVNPNMALFRDISGTPIPEDSIENDYTFRRLAEQAKAERLRMLDDRLSRPGGLLGEGRSLPEAAR